VIEAFLKKVKQPGINHVTYIKLFFNLKIKVMGYHEWKSCIDACLKCASICNHCAISCTQEDDVKMMARCIELDMQCAAICYSAAQLMSMGSPFAQDICRICADICQQCGEECSNHHTQHCKECADACKACAEECRRMTGVAT